MASPSLCSQVESNLTSNRKVIEVLLRLKSKKAHGENYIKVVPLLVHQLLRNRLSCNACFQFCHLGDLATVSETKENAV